MKTTFRSPGSRRFLIRCCLLLTALVAGITFAGVKPASASLIVGLLYGGPCPTVRAEGDVRTGSLIFADREYSFAGLPTGLEGADHVLTSNSDKYYIATNLLEFSVKSDALVSVAHDNRVERPAWLTNQFKPTDLMVRLEGAPMRVFQHQAAAGEHLVLGGNVGVPDGRPCLMYLVFVNPATRK